MVASRKMREAARPTGAELGTPALCAIDLGAKFFRLVAMDVHIGSDDVSVRQRSLVAICSNLVSVRLQIWKDIQGHSYQKNMGVKNIAIKVWV